MNQSYLDKYPEISIYNNTVTFYSNSSKDSTRYERHTFSTLFKRKVSSVRGSLRDIEQTAGQVECPHSVVHVKC